MIHGNNKKHDDLPGFRLHRFEVLNWGTFDKKIWKLDTAGYNSLLTGDIGSGKSTLVDALTTLLVPAGKITYNKAAGAEGKERSLRDYILGHYKKEKDVDAQMAKAVPLRENDNTLTILLGCFYDRNFNETVTLAQIFWLKEGKTQVERFFIVSASPLTIEKDLYISGTDVLNLKKKIKTLPSTVVHETYSAYSADFRRRMAIQTSQAIDLLYQTVSMKSIGNLTEFVRTHMLDEFPVQDRIDNLCRNFTNLNQAHEAVLKARQQIETLKPMIEECDKYDEIEKGILDLRSSRDCLYSYMADIEMKLLEAKIEHLGNEKKKITQRIDKIEKESEILGSAREKIRRDIEDNGGRRLAELEKEIDELNDEKKRRKNRSGFYADLGTKINIPLPADDTGFYGNIILVNKKIAEIESQQKEKRAEEIESQVELRSLQKNFGEIEVELKSLRQRPTNIPARNLAIRKELCTSLGITEERIPFAGELLEIKEDDQIWEGALERVLHNFGLSLLVEDDLYAKVTEYVDRTNLKGRLVYYRVKRKKEDIIISPDPEHLLNKIRIKPDTSFYRWLEVEIYSRFDYICCRNLDEFRHHPRGITAAGQIKSGEIRHEKDDRYNIHDRTRYILGWKNELKIEHLEKDLASTQLNITRIQSDLSRIESIINNMGILRDSAREIITIQDFREIDWQSIAVRIEECETEVKEIENSADILRTLKEQLTKIEKEFADKREKNNLLQNEHGEINRNISDSETAFKEADKTFNSIDPELRDKNFHVITGIQNIVMPDKKITLTSIKSSQMEIREYIQKQMDNLTEQNKRRNSRISGQMQNYKIRYPMETSEMDASIESAAEFRKILSDLISQDLPRHEDRFKRLLREGTIQDIALFQNQMEKERLEIINKINIINKSLHEIEYNRGSYITLIPDRTIDQEIRLFQEDLRLCLGETLSNEGGDIYTETKFQQVKALIDRFQGRPGLTDADKRWTAKVTDVRNWFIFSASERWFDDDKEKEFYSDSSGKSGGQKEKLAYTILAAALAFQFNLGQDGLWNRSFRFVMIDEAFGRGSDESARYGLQLFEKLQLQLLIVTPLQKIHVIENYVNTVHFVYQEGNVSLVGNMSIEQYKENKKNMVFK